jgi:acetyl-CoA acetyltransferase family protein
MGEALIIDAVRTPMGRYRGALAGVRPDDLAAHTIGAAVERTGIEPAEVADVYWGAANQSGEDNRDVARMASLLAGLPVEVPGVTVNRLCASGLEAVNQAARALRLGEADLYLAGGSESMSRAPWVVPKPTDGLPRGERTMYDTALGWRLINPRMAELYSTEAMGETAENVAERHSISREDQDAFALASHRRAIAARDQGLFSEQLVAIEAPDGRGTKLVAEDEGPRPDTSLERLASLRPAFREGGSVTAGNASTLNDGGAAVVVTSLEYARAHGLTVLARIDGYATGAVEPQELFFAPVRAVERLMSRTGTKIGDYELIEANEAFASQALADGQMLGWNWDRVNVHGGAIALGHPIGASGARVLTTLLYAMHDRDATTGLATLCLGGGDAVAMSVSREV